jgi:hypothetical protein
MAHAKTPGRQRATGWLKTESFSLNPEPLNLFDVKDHPTRHFTITDGKAGS